MKSIKPGRGPSMMGGVVGIFMVCFGIFWTVMAAQASGFMAIFGIIWTCIAIATTIYNFKNATGKNRYSQYDITDENEEPDPFNERFGGNSFERWTAEDETPGSRFCPYCGAKAKEDFEFCNKCGKRLP
ncbi:MAG: zinc ribbon domain-containing protein [Clostridia bacterium]|nr:zinc ribbon domain-containing protein [Clostridia bacterium]